ncbi:hypothetical protein NDU88_000866 [Pleurodeles waltl]|uniref:Uncharacterized protein n=1 Tax=Pleurodeles waltl TaxID=8319 RepID=A0AAV7S5S5_PLEWA|nr:hypothetical protein NDU88_000866 [Pleurodeles waltl]
MSSAYGSEFRCVAFVQAEFFNVGMAEEKVQETPQLLKEVGCLDLIVGGKATVQLARPAWGKAAQRNFRKAAQAGALDEGQEAGQAFSMALAEKREILEAPGGTGHNRVMHYLDDNFFVTDSGFADCQRLLVSFQQLMEDVVVPKAPENMVGPVTCIYFLGIEFNSEEMMLAYR